MRYATYVLLSAWLLSAQTAKPPDTAAAPKPTGSVHGVVKDESTGAPLPDITVQLVTNRMQEGAGGIFSTAISTSTTTDEEGRYVFSAVTPGVLRVNVSKSRLEGNVTHSIRIDADQDASLNFLMPSAPTISGRVLNRDKEPIVDAFVWVIQSEYRNGGLRRGKIGPQVTGEDGGFSFDAGLEAARTYYVLVDRSLPDDAAAHEPVPPDQREPIEAPTYYGDATSLEAATPLVLRPSENREHLDIAVRQAKTYCVDGKVEVAGKPASLSLAFSELPLEGAGLTRAIVNSAEDGAFRVCDLTPGQYAVSTNGSQKQAGKLDFAIAASDVHHLHLAVDSVPLHLELAWDGDPPPASAEVARPFHLQGNIAIELTRDDNGERSPVSPDQIRKRLGSAQGSEISVNLIGVGAMAADAANLNEVSTGFQTESAPFGGPFGSGMPAGDYAVQVRLVSGAYVKQMSYDGIAISDGLLHLASGTSGTLRVVASQGGGTLTCNTVDSDGNPVADATVVTIPENVTTAARLSQLSQATTDATGTVKSPTLAPGKYRVLALTRAYRRIPDDIDKLLLALSKAQEVEVIASANLQVTLKPIPID